MPCPYFWLTPLRIKILRLLGNCVASIFYDEYAIQFYDPDHSKHEERYILLGTENSEKVCKSLILGGAYLHK